MDKNVNKNIFGEEKNMECTLYLTDSCNLKCSYCYEGDSKNSIFLTEEKLRLALNYIKTNNPVNDDIHLTLLGGEPLLNKKLLRKVFEIINNESGLIVDRSIQKFTKAIMDIHKLKFSKYKMQKYVEMQIESIKYQLEDKRFENRPDSIVQTLTAQKVILEQTLQYFKEI